MIEKEMEQYRIKIEHKRNKKGNKNNGKLHGMDW